MKEISMKELKLVNGGHEITPFHRIGDDEYPYGKFDDQGVFHINYTATMDGEDGGYEMLPLYGVKWDEYYYGIYIGEPPHKNESGEWTTYNDVPHFVVGAFAGADFIDKKPEKPHFIRMMTEAFDQNIMSRRDEYVKDLENYRRMYENPTFSYCFKGMFKSVWRKVNKYLGFGKGTHMYYAWAYFGDSRLFFGKEFDGSETFFDWSNETWIRRLYLKEDGKFCLHYKKWENDNTYCDC